MPLHASLGLEPHVQHCPNDGARRAHWNRNRLSMRSGTAMQEGGSVAPGDRRGGPVGSLSNPARS